MGGCEKGARIKGFNYKQRTSGRRNRALLPAPRSNYKRENRATRRTMEKNSQKKGERKKGKYRGNKWVRAREKIGIEYNGIAVKTSPLKN